MACVCAWGRGTSHPLRPDNCPSQQRHRSGYLLAVIIIVVVVACVVLGHATGGVKVELAYHVANSIFHLHMTGEMSEG